MPEVVRPASSESAAGALAAAAARGQAARIVGGATKLRWGTPVPAAALELRTEGLSEILEHNAGDLTAVLQAGVPLSRAQAAFASAGQMLAIDPWLGPEDQATVGGVVATADSGPLRHRYGAPRDLVVGMTVALSDGTVARSGGKVIKNVAGYDLAKLFCGSFGTLGLILEVNVRLHPRPESTATAVGTSSDPAALAAAAGALAGAPLELEALDVTWSAGRGRILAQSGGAAAWSRAERVGEQLRAAGLDQVEVTGEDAGLWEAQRAAQRAPAGAAIRISTRPSRLAAVLAAARDAGGTAVGRAGLGLSFVSVDPDAVGRLIAALPAGAHAVLLDAPEALRTPAAVWGPSPGAAGALMRRVKDRFDPARACNPGIFVGGI